MLSTLKHELRAMILSHPELQRASNQFRFARRLSKVREASGRVLGKSEELRTVGFIRSVSAAKR